MWEVEFFMSEELPYNNIASADVYACEDTYLPIFFGLNNLNCPRFLKTI